MTLWSPTSIYKPNGLCFSPDYKKLYVADTGRDHDYQSVPPSGRSRSGTLHGAQVEERQSLRRRWNFRRSTAQKVAGFADGIRADVDGNIWSSAGWGGEGFDGVHVFAPDGTRIGQILLPEVCANVCFGGTKRNRLFMTASQSLYAVYVETRGAHIT